LNQFSGLFTSGKSPEGMPCPRAYTPIRVFHFRRKYFSRIHGYRVFSTLPFSDSAYTIFSEVGHYPPAFIINEREHSATYIHVCTIYKLQVGYITITRGINSSLRKIIFSICYPRFNFPYYCKLAFDCVLKGLFCAIKFNLGLTEGGFLGPELI